MSLFDEYSKDPVATWKALNAKTLSQLDSEGVIDEVVLVAEEIVRRVHHNLTLVVERLTNVGYEFSEPDRVLAPPSDDVEALLSQLDQLSGRCETQGHRGKPLAPILRAWYRRIGCVDLTGSHPAWPVPEVKPGKESYAAPQFMTDALVVNPLEDLRVDLEERLADGPTWSVGFSPDIYHKADVSGGPMYQFFLIPPMADVVCIEIDDDFVKYLRQVMKWSGFPGFRHYKNAPKKFLKELQKDLLEF